MITSVQIESFRGIREGGVEGLAPISILVGPNNTGKSTVLEAIAAVGYGQRVDAVVELLSRRGGPPLDALERIVTEGAGKAKLTVGGTDGDAPATWHNEIITPVRGPYQRTAAIEAGLQEPLTSFSAGGVVVWVDLHGKRSSIFEGVGRTISVRPEDFRSQFLVRFVDVEAVRRVGALEDAYTDIDRAGRTDAIVQALKRAMVGLRDLRILKSRDQFILHAFYTDRPPVPVFLAGDGFKRFLTVAAAVLAEPRGVLLLEEPESFQHPRYLQELAALLHLAAREGTQVILSTHSIELIDLLLQAPESAGLPYPAVHRLSLNDGKLRATTLDHERALRIREDLLQDLRA